ncbi:MAG: sulfate ABC transporter substrate-binding protein [Chloroflexota bacterium]|nr:sulfate ABC transporter substrate-binding protein [Chloroflexota bacterium]
MKMKRILIFVTLFAFLLVGCSSGVEATSENEVKLILGAYTTPREAYGEIIPLFQEFWYSKTGQRVIFEESYLGSGAQSRAVVNGFEADVVALSLEADVNRIQEAGLITHDWKQGDYKGIVTTSVVSFVVREGNPEDVQDWGDLAQNGLEVLTPNPNTSGGAMWNILALYGAALRGHVEGVPADDPESAAAFLRQVLSNVSVMDKAARDSILNFEKGIGDLAITYENEVIVGRQSGQKYELVLPSSSILIENPIALVDESVDKHGAREVAEAFMDFVYSSQAQTIYAEHGLRVVNPEVAAASESQYPAIEDLFTVQYFGGWEEIMENIFGEEGVYSRAILQVQIGE